MSSRAEAPAPPAAAGHAARAIGWLDRWNARLSSLGVLALASLALAVLSGVVLAIGYDVRDAADSLQLLELHSAPGRVLRAVHAYSGHLLLLLTLLHLVEHLLRGTDRRPRFGLWLRLVLGLPVLLGVMLTGFMLKGDAEARLARQILDGLLLRLPGLGQALATALLGTGEDLQVVYVHHAATLSILLVWVALEHARRVWPTAASVIAVSALALGLGLLAPPGLHAGIDPVVKGPWYFVGLQEWLHWLSQPGWLWLAAAALLAILAWLPRVRPGARRALLTALALSFVAYALSGAWAQWCRGPGWRAQRPWARGDRVSSQAPANLLAPLALAPSPPQEAPRVLGRREGCLLCHGRVTGLAKAHAPGGTGCVACHLGDPFSADADRAHDGMIAVPGNLDTAAQSCGQSGCHDAIVARVEGSLMATAVGMVAIDRLVFGEQGSPDGTAGAADVAGSPADRHLRTLCLTCHLGVTQERPIATDHLPHGGGCVACHRVDSGGPRYSAANAEAFAHPRLTVQVEDARCFGCHNRSGRIALNYRGFAETGVQREPCATCPKGVLMEAKDGQAPAEPWVLDDGRELRYVAADVHQTAGMTCIDCHTARELMGDGDAYDHEEDAVEVRCQTCHRADAAETVSWSQLDSESQAVIRLREDAQPERAYVLRDLDPRLPRRARAFTNAAAGPGQTVLIRRKHDGRVLEAKPPAAACAGLKGHDRLTCKACHAAWAPQCAVCHTQWDPNLEARDALTGKTTRGGYVELQDNPRADPPTLGVREGASGARIEPFVPGMIMTLNPPGHGPDVSRGLPADTAQLIAEGTIFHRRYAPVAPHTSAKRGRTCKSCHNDPLALGYGRGQLELVGEGERARWRFTPMYERLPQDGLPADAWIGVAQARGLEATTRRDARPFDLEEQRRVLVVGACLTCHDPDVEPARGELYRDFESSLRSPSPRCVLPRSVEDAEVPLTR